MDNFVSLVATVWKYWGIATSAAIYIIGWAAWAIGRKQV